MPMKKTFLLMALCFLTACVHAGDVDILKSRKDFFSSWQTENIDYYVDSEEAQGSLVNVEEITFEDIERGVAATTRTGAMMISSQTDAFNTYETERLRATKSAVLSSSYSPIYIHRDEVFNTFGEVTIEGGRYMLVRNEDHGDILIIDGEGKIFNRIGRLVNGRLAILDAYFFIEPHDVRIVPFIQSVTKTNERIDGFELFYTGIENQEMTFSYVSLDATQEVEKFSFPMDQKQIEINGLKIDILDVDYNKITYLIN